MRKRKPVPETGCECYEGRPGSGKSFRAVHLLIDFIVTKRRPVFTNLPLNFRVVRSLLKARGGEALAGLIFPLTETHYRAFLVRANVRAAFVREWKEKCRTEGRPWRRGKCLAAFYEKHGSNVRTGPNANWIDMGSMTILDEVQQWFSQENQKTEMPELRRYLEMYRHFGHWIIYITQNRMQVSIYFRRQTQFYWHVINASDDKVYWGIKGKHIGLFAFSYAKFTPELEDTANRLGGAAAEPIEFFYLFYWLPRWRYIFRLYESYTHAGGIHEMQRGIDEMRSELGVADVPRRLRRREVDVHWSYAGLACTVAIFAGFMMGRSVLTKEAGGTVNAPAGDGVNVAAGVLPVEKEWWKGKELGMITADAVFVGSDRVKVGGTFEGAHNVTCTVIDLDAKGRRVGIAADGRVYVWVRGQSKPSPGVSTGNLLAKLRARGGGGDGPAGIPRGGSVAGQAGEPRSGG